MHKISIPEYPVIIPLRSAPPKQAAGKDHAPEPIFIETNNYVVRSLYAEDVNEQFLNWFNTPKMLSGLNIDRLDFTVERLKLFISGFDNYRSYFLGIFYNNEIVGFYTIDVNFTHATGNITTGIGNDKYLGKNILRLTIDAMLDYFYEYRNIEKFIARILAKNFAMLFNFRDNERFALEAHLKRECRAPDGRRVDMLVFASHKDGLITPNNSKNNKSTDK